MCGKHTFTVFGLVLVGRNASATARVILVVNEISGQAPGCSLARFKHKEVKESHAEAKLDLIYSY